MVVDFASALGVVVQHGATLFHPRDLAQLAATSSAPSEAVEIAFDALFQHVAARAGKDLRACFAKPTRGVIDSCGWGRACKCVFTAECAHCGGIGGYANPLTMTRTCCACADTEQSTFACTLAAATSRFKLDAEDAATLKAAHLHDGSIVVLISDAVALAFEKWCGAGGLATQIAGTAGGLSADELAQIKTTGSNCVPIGFASVARPSHKRDELWHIISSVRLGRWRATASATSDDRYVQYENSVCCYMYAAGHRPGCYSTCATCSICGPRWLVEMHENAIYCL